MTKYEELTDIITHNKNKDKKLAKKIFDDDKEDDDIELEVSGSESSSAPLVGCVLCLGFYFYGDEIQDKTHVYVALLCHTM
jgi:hypothetical protein